MDAKAVIKRLCELQRDVSDVIGYSYAADCFCGDGGFGPNHVNSDHYRNDGKSLEFIERVTRAALAQMKEPAPPLSKKRMLLDRAVDVMSALHRAIEPEEEDPELAGRISPATLRTFVDALADIDRERCRLPAEQPAALTSNEESAFEAWWDEVNRQSFIAAYGLNEPYRPNWGSGHKSYARDGWLARAASRVETNGELESLREEVAKYKAWAASCEPTPCSACLDAHSQIPGYFGIPDGDIADRVSDLVERIEQVWQERDELKETLAHLARGGVTAETSTEWRSMDSAPRDGREVLLKVELRAGIPGRCLVGHHMAGGHCIQDHPPIEEGWYFWNGRMFDRESKPIAWMPLPAELPVKSTTESDHG